MPDDVRIERVDLQRRAARAMGDSGDLQILFGDLHVHTTLSADAYAASLPIVQGEGAHPVDDACDFARFCSALDFFSINDHAESLTAKDWSKTRRAIRRCNEVAGDPEDPDIVAYLGWEWTQVGATPRDHYGHRNVVLLETEDDQVPAQPIAAARPGYAAEIQTALGFAGSPRLSSSEREAYREFAAFLETRVSRPRCGEVRRGDTGRECVDVAKTPAELFAKLRAWETPALVIPHGTAWGPSNPTGSSFTPSLAGNHDPDFERLVEVYSGHGSSEEYRPWSPAAIDAVGRERCPDPSASFMPCCWRAGEIIEERCLAEGLESSHCSQRAELARRRYILAKQSGRFTVPGATLDEWGRCDQCTDCFLPAFDYRTSRTVQAALALTRGDGGEGPAGRFRFGFIASSDDHSARPGTGYKEFGRPWMTDARGARSRFWSRVAGFEPAVERPEARSRSVQPGPNDRERIMSFFYTGGLVAAHARRDRHSIWRALKRRQVYGTSGERILLWFDLLSPEGDTLTAPMGSVVRMLDNPRFRVRAAGALVQKPGCLDPTRDILGSSRLQRLCRGECYRPSDVRKRIHRVEVVRIRPRLRADERMDSLIDDPWLLLDCPDSAAGCVVDFDDPEFAALGRDTIYYVRALQEPTPTVNGDDLRCTMDEAGRCVGVRPCFAGYRGRRDDDCLAPTQERAWSSPIFVDFAPR